ncbi:low molecular weight phosphotyrosine protein phosphatase [Eubacteriales bacterium OttesenSCG-928-N13]|nr:low molecular weight phosphotyrosine protein phosphatase [Eubacteriales bacterium OttesenSCG-928-N13]
MKKIMFVCHGNICRSTMAEFVMKDLLRKEGLDKHWQVQSSATSTEEIGNDTHPGTRRALHAHGIPFERRHAVQMRKQDYAQFDRWIGMDGRNIQNMLRILGGDPDHKVMRLLDLTDHPRDIADPWYTGEFEQTYSDVLEGCEALLAQIREGLI